MSGATWRVWVFGAAIVAAGCSSAPPVEPQARELAEAVCSLVSRCCTPPEMDYYLGPFVSDADCAERMLQQATLDMSAVFSGGPLAQVRLPNLAALERATRDGRVRLDRAAIEACLAWLNDQRCNEPSPPDDAVDACDPAPPRPSSPCDAALLVEGRVPEGGACSGGLSSFECQRDLVCLRDPAELGGLGTCAALQQLDEPCGSDTHCAEGLYCSLVEGACRVPAALGEACAYAESGDRLPSETQLLIQCEAGLGCSPFTSTCVATCVRGARCFEREAHPCGEDTGLVCVSSSPSYPWPGFCDAPRSAGEPCDDYDDCEASLDCALDADEDVRRCQPRLANGEPCSWDEACQSNVCPPSSGLGGHVCADPAAVGEPCDANEHCASGYCEWTTEGRCAATVANGQPCASGSDAQCTDGFCTYDEGLGGSYCVAFTPTGGACTSDQTCASGACVVGACAQLPLPDGELCDDSSECESSFCHEDAATPRCRTLPLGVGAPCSDSETCASGVCFGRWCQFGAAVGAPCGEQLLPCEPISSFCDTELEVPVCTAHRETGESCLRDVECRGECVVQWGRQLCSPVAVPGAAVCDGL